MQGFPARLAAALAAALLTAGAALASPFDDLLKRVPDSANAVLYANIRALYSSPFGVSRNWQQKLQGSFQGGLTGLPPVAERVVIAQHIDPSSMQPAWRIELVQVGQEIKPEDVVRREAGTRDLVSGLPVVFSPRGSVFVFFNPRTLAEAIPPDRQKLSRWIRFCDHSTGPSVSPYLRGAAEESAAGAQAVFAVDLKDMFDPAGIGGG